MEGYDPLRSPLELPILVWSATLRLERSIDLPEVAGASLATSLRGALGEGLRAVACRSDRGCGRECAGAPGCTVPALWSPRSLAQRRTHPPPIALAVRKESGGRLAGRVALWGRTALAERATVRSALRAAGGRGLHVPERAPARFEVDLELAYEGTLAGWAAARGIADAARVRARFGGPGGEGSKRASFEDLLANAAHDLVQWDLCDRGLDAELGKAGCDAHAEAARDLVRDSLRAVRVEGEFRRTTALRESTTNGHTFPHVELGGAVQLEGDLAPLAPWLALAELRGIGPRVSFSTPPELALG